MDSRQELTEEIRLPRGHGPYRIGLTTEHERFSRELELGESLLIGSGPAAQLRVEDRAVSGLHLRVEASRDGVRLLDLGSKNGLFVGGARVVGPVTLALGAAATLGRSTLTVELATDAGDEPGEPLPGLVGSTPQMLALAQKVRRFARLRRPVLVQGESGAGKDLVARALHELSGRAGAYVPLNVATLPESLADSELFGHTKGAFTGAHAQRHGAFPAADGGTLFLDEVAELAPALQAKLLRVVEDGRVRLLGGGERTVDVRLVTASWASLGELALEGRFREDLYHRLAQLVVVVPPLRERLGDIGALAALALARHEAELGPKQLSPAGLSRLLTHRWPGNVRELLAVVFRAALESDGVEVGASDVERALAPAAAVAARAQKDAVLMLKRHDGNITAAARAAGVPRSTFRDRLSKARYREVEDPDPSFVAPLVAERRSW